MTKQYCVRGHNTLVVGRTQRMCRECRRIADRARNARNRARSSTWARLVAWVRGD